MKKIAVILLFIGGIVTLYGQNNAVLDSAINNITQQLLVFPQEKVYLHTDKPYYITGEKIFFRAFLLDAFSNKQATQSRYVYVELINPADSVVQRLKIRPDEDNLFYGVIPLAEDLPQGTYKIRAYTQYMYNQGESSFFSNCVRISDPQILSIQTQTDFQFTEDGKINTSLHDFDVSFYPEGGQLIAGQSSSVAFKAVDTNGTALDIEGEVTDSKGNVVAAFKTFHDGMGEFFINSLPDEHYQAVCRNGNRTLRFDLPEAQTNTFALKTIIRENTLWIAVNKKERWILQEDFTN